MLKEEVGCCSSFPGTTSSKSGMSRYVLYFWKVFWQVQLLYVPVVVEEYCYKVVMLEMSPTIIYPRSWATVIHATLLNFMTFHD